MVNVKKKKKKKKKNIVHDWIKMEKNLQKVDQIFSAKTLFGASLRAFFTPVVDRLGFAISVAKWANITL